MTTDLLFLHICLIIVGHIAVFFYCYMYLELVKLQSLISDLVCLDVG